MKQRQKPLSTADVPSRFLKAAFLVGHVPQQVLASDPRISYSLYVPPPPIYTARPPSARSKLPLLVYIHGTGRDLAPMRNELAAFAESMPCAVVAPLFPIGLEGPEDISSYKVLQTATGTFRSDEALLAIVHAIEQRYPGIETEKFFLMGFSGGGQFTHRFLYIYPERVAAAAVGGPGTVTFLNGDGVWPNGVGNVEEIFKRPMNWEVLRQVPVSIFIGDKDVDLHGGEEFWAWLKERRRSRTAEDGQPKKQEEAGTRNNSRLDGAKLLLEDWKSKNLDCQLEVVGGVAHDNNAMRGPMLKFIGSKMKKQAGNGEEGQGQKTA